MQSGESDRWATEHSSPIFTLSTENWPLSCKGGCDDLLGPGTALGRRVFRDQTDLGVSPDLWPSVEQALSESEYLILLASLNAAESEFA